MNAAAVNQCLKSPVRNALQSPLHTTFKPSPLNAATFLPVTCTFICPCPLLVKQCMWCLKIHCLRFAGIWKI